MAFGEKILEVANNDGADWNYNAESGKLTINKEAILRSKVKIETMQFHMSRLHRETWGDRQQIDIKNDFSQMSEQERIRKAMELIGVIKEITGPKPEPPPLRYDPGTEEPEPVGIGS